MRQKGFAAAERERDAMRRDRCRRAQGMSLSLPLSICQLGSRIGNSRDYGFSTLEKCNVTYQCC